ncbi:hypothetical protein DV515_00002274 [Chloebia gouldiae]|uniref:Uncharacterized protein n=1 Tax=Chloebia gouldiae TaxID=44316 RepID=A0A3L8SW90_CHLGU|nr:hypothetical protein DV515_00002274 [Chloebia gouldiae]
MWLLLEQRRASAFLVLLIAMSAEVNMCLYFIHSTKFCWFGLFGFFEANSGVSVLLKSSICFLAYSRPVLGLDCSLWSSCVRAQLPQLCVG